MNSEKENEATDIDDSLARLALRDDPGSDASTEKPCDVQKPSPATVVTLSESAETLESGAGAGQDRTTKQQTPDSTQAARTPTTTVLPTSKNDFFTPNALEEPVAPLEVDEALLAALRSLDNEDVHLDFGGDLFESSDSADEELDQLVLQQHADELLEFNVDANIFDDIADKRQVEEQLKHIDEAEALIHGLGVLSLFDCQLDEVFEGGREKEGDNDEGLPGLDSIDSIPEYMLCRPCDPEQQVETAEEMVRGLKDDDIDSEGEYPEPFPPYLFCQPCNPDQQVETDEAYLERSLRTMENHDTHVLDNDETVDEGDENFQEFLISRRPQAVASALAFTTSFATGIYQPVQDGATPKNERTCLGHKETIYGLNFSGCGRYFATASQDATIRVWDAATNSLLSTLKGHSTSFECLRATWASSDWAASVFPKKKNQEDPALVASGGADGTVKLWMSTDPSRKESWSCIGTLDHSRWKTTSVAPGEDESEKDRDVPQIYALEFIEHWQGLASQQGCNRFLMTSSDDHIHLWEVKLKPEVASSDAVNKVQFEEILSLRFKSTQDFNSGVSVVHVTASAFDWTNSCSPKQAVATDKAVNSSAGGGFGGVRNPDNIIFVFDASYCEETGLLGVALSDGTLRLVNGRGVCVAILALPGGHQSHLTAFAWDSTGSRLASCVATGHLILWHIDIGDGRGNVEASCEAVLDGGHVPGRPLFGVKYCGAEQEDLVLSWGVDGRLCLWDAESQGQINAPISTLVSRPEYPIYAVDVSSYVKPSAGSSLPPLCTVGVGGGREGGFVGLPFYLYDVNKFTGT